MPAKRKRAPTLPNPASFSGTPAEEPTTTALAPAPQQQVVVALPVIPWWVWLGAGVALGYGAPRVLGSVKTKMFGG